ncbi:MAG: ABC transporter permease [Bacteroidaceae bacterium]|nr:ABC transporter permease [Bacteroidaceae bacterium]MBQ7442676.1 ABC transporter permease [Bacteroidaceae bacterium]
MEMSTTNNKGSNPTSRQPLPSLHGRGWGWVFLWSHRRQNGWVIAEIILITVLSFYCIDHLTVTTYDRYFCRPAGEFEREHLVVGQTGIAHHQPLPKGGEPPEVENNSVANTSGNGFPSLGEGLGVGQEGLSSLYALRDQIRALPEVQYAGFAGHIIGQGTYNISSYASEADSTRRCGAYMQGFLLHEQYFETLGLTPIEGSPSAKELSEDCPLDGVVITRSLAQALFDTDQVVGRRIVEWDFSDRALQEHGEPVIVSHYTIAGVVEDFRLEQNDRYAYSILTPIIEEYATPQMLIRLKPEADAEAFINHYQTVSVPVGFPDGRSSASLLQAGNHFLYSLQTYKDWLSSWSGNRDYNLTNTLLGILLALFLLNVVLGTLGTFWLQLRKRTEDIGIMRSFGAKRRDIFWMVWGEAALLTLLACIVGQLIWFQFAINMDLSDGLSMSGTGRERNWVEIFWIHYLVICVIQYVIMLCVVTLAIAIPIWRAVHKRPVDAMRQDS